MSINLSKPTKVKVVDRTLPELVWKKSGVKRLEIIYFCWLLKDIGVDLFEVDWGILDTIGKLPTGLDFVCRIRNEEDAVKCVKNNIKECIITEDMLKRNELFDVLRKRSVKIQLECYIEKVKEIEDLKQLKASSNFGLVNEIRITGLNAVSSVQWTDKVIEAGEALGVNMSICPQNRYFNATAMCLEGIMNNINSITLSFMGYGREPGYAALEEVLVAAKVLINQDMKIDLNGLPEMTRFFSRLTGINVPESKAVVGKGIFKYQSGIHADGIEKDPSTYEPFDPSIVGQERRLTVGKHSGRRAVQKKLKELGIKCRIDEAADILNCIRQKSIEYKRDLFDSELIDIYKNRLVCAI